MHKSEGTTAFCKCPALVAGGAGKCATAYPTSGFISALELDKDGSQLWLTLLGVEVKQVTAEEFINSFDRDRRAIFLQSYGRLLTSTTFCTRDFSSCNFRYRSSEVFHIERVDLLQLAERPGAAWMKQPGAVRRAAANGVTAIAPYTRLIEEA